MTSLSRLALRRRLRGESLQAFSKHPVEGRERVDDIRERRQGDTAGLSSADYKVTGVDASFEGDEHS